MTTLKDVSQEAGLAVGTVSRVLNNRGYISAQTRQKVEEAVKKLNYYPSELARAFSKQTIAIIGVILPYINNPYFAELLSKIESIALEKGYQIMVFSSAGEEKQELYFVEKCLRNKLAGIIICSGKISSEKLNELGLPVIAIECAPKQYSSRIECDNFDGGVKAASLLISKGCTHVLYLSGVQGKVMPADKRGSGFTSECKKHDSVEYYEAKFSESEFRSMNYRDFITKTLTAIPTIDGIFASNDILAAQVLQYCHTYGIRVPEDMKVIGFDDIPFASWTVPALTTIHQPIREMAAMALEMLVSERENKTILKYIKLPVEIVMRDTV